jgi:phage gpG-like protein
MAVVATPLNSSLRIIVETGFDEEGKPIYRTRTYNNVKTAVSDEDLMSVANQLADIQSHPVYAVRRIVETQLTEEF